jgi:hypothetical protein
VVRVDGKEAQGPRNVLGFRFFCECGIGMQSQCIVFVKGNPTVTAPEGTQAHTTVAAKHNR